MTYNHNAFGNGLGLPGSGFASRGKANNMQRLTVNSPTPATSTEENLPTPRTSRSHLLAGLRTAPKSPAYPLSAPPIQTEQRMGLDASRYAAQEYGQRSMPKSATVSAFSHVPQSQYQGNHAAQFYSPDQVLAPPAIQIDDEDDARMDPNYYAELVRTNHYLAQQQMRLQQQLINVTAAAQQFQNMNLGQYNQAPPMTPGLGFYNQQAQNGVQPIVEPVPQQPGLYTVFNPLTGQTNYFFDQQSQQQQQQQLTPQQHPYSNLELSHSPPPPTPTFRAQVSPPPQEAPATSAPKWRSNTPPKVAPSPPRDDVTPLPPSSVNAFRANNRKSINLTNNVNASAIDALKTAPKSATFPQTPLTGTFGPGQAREGDHPLRQPRGPPPLEELLAKPTTKDEGSKNFASRQRRAAVKDVRAVMQRRTASHGAGSVDSADSLSPTSEPDITFSVSSDDNDTESVRSGTGSASLPGRPSLGNFHTLTPSTGAIGSERKERKDLSRDRCQPGAIAAKASTGREMLAVKVDELIEKRKTPLLVLTNAEKRRSGVF